jgi:CBS domain-containing protein
MDGVNLSEIVTYNPWSVQPETLLGEIAERFRTMRIHHVPVVDRNRRPIGMISETDVLRARQSRRMLAVVGGAAEEDTSWSGQSAEQVMTRDPLTVRASDDARAALGLLLKHHIHALPVVDRERLVGVVTCRDFLREFSYGQLACSRELISTIASPCAETLEPDATLEQALLTMHEIGVTCLAVAQDGCPLGVLTQRDIVRAHCLANEEADIDLGDFATPPNVMRAARSGPTIRPGQRLFEAAGIMTAEGLSAVVVVNQSSHLQGLVTEDDLIGVMYAASSS